MLSEPHLAQQAAFLCSNPLESSQSAYQLSVNCVLLLFCSLCLFFLLIFFRIVFPLSHFTIEEPWDMPIYKRRSIWIVYIYTIVYDTPHIYTYLLCFSVYKQTKCVRVSAFASFSFNQVAEAFTLSHCIHFVYCNLCAFIRWCDVRYYPEFVIFVYNNCICSTGE